MVLCAPPPRILTSVSFHRIAANVGSRSARRRRPLLSSRAEEFQIRALPEPCMNLSIHTAAPTEGGLPIPNIAQVKTPNDVVMLKHARNTVETIFRAGNT